MPGTSGAANPRARVGGPAACYNQQYFGETINPMQIVLNGEPRSLSAPVTVAGLLDALGLAGARVAVELNREIVPRSRHGEQPVRDGDRVEVVRAIGGG